MIITKMMMAVIRMIPYSTYLQIVKTHPYLMRFQQRPMKIQMSFLMFQMVTMISTPRDDIRKERETKWTDIPKVVYIHT